MTKILATLILCVSVTLPALAFEEPDGFHGVKWGATPEQVQDMILRAWQPGNDSRGDVNCQSGRNVCGHSGKLGPVDVHFGYMFKNDMFVSGIVRFKSADYATVRRIFDERYGAPTKRWREEIRSKMGVPHEQESSLWKGAKASVTLSRFGQRLDRGIAGVGLNEVVEHDMAERDKAITKGKDDL